MEKVLINHNLVKIIYDYLPSVCDRRAFSETNKRLYNISKKWKIDTKCHINNPKCIRKNTLNIHLKHICATGNTYNKTFISTEICDYKPYFKIAIANGHLHIIQYLARYTKLSVTDHSNIIIDAIMYDRPKICTWALSCSSTIFESSNVFYLDDYFCYRKSAKKAEKYMNANNY